MSAGYYYVLIQNRDISSPQQSRQTTCKIWHVISILRLTGLWCYLLWEMWVCKITEFIWSVVQFSTRAGTGSASPVTAFSAAFFFFLAAWKIFHRKKYSASPLFTLGLAEVFRSLTISSSWTDLSDFTRDSSKGNPGEMVNWDQTFLVSRGYQILSHL